MESVSRPTQLPRRRSRSISLSVAVVLLLVVGAVVLIVRQGDDRPGRDVRGAGPGPRIAVPLPHPHTIMHKGVRYAVRQSVVEAASVGHRDGLDVFVFAADGSVPACTSLRPSARVVRQNATSVVVAGFSYDARTPKGEYTCSFFSADNQPLDHRLPLRLSAPLGRRRVIDADTGEQVGVVQRYRAHTPGYLPAGFHELRDDHDPALHGFSAQTQFMAVRQYERGKDTVEIYTSSADKTGGYGHVRATVDVHGARAQVTDDTGQRCISWDGGNGFGSEVCSSNYNSPWLSVASLTKIARSLH